MKGKTKRVETIANSHNILRYTRKEYQQLAQDLVEAQKLLREAAAWLSIEDGGSSARRARLMILAYFLEEV